MRCAALVFVAVAVYLTASGALVILGISSLMDAAWLLGGLETMGPYLFFLTAAVAAIVAYGLVRRRTWARRAGIVCAAIFAFNAIPAISAAVATQRVLPIAREAAKLVMAVVVIQRLWPPRPATSLFES